MIVFASLVLLAGGYWLWDRARVQREAVAYALADSVARVEQQARRIANRRTVDERTAALPQPFARLLSSMIKREPQLGTDGVRHKIDDSSGVTAADGFYIHDLIRQVKPRRTVEVGLAEGFSAMYMLAALHSNGSGTHVAMDPYGISYWKGIGVQKVKEAGMTTRFRFMEAKSIAALPQLAEEKQTFEIIFIDGDHRFDGAFTDFILADEICPRDCYILLHDPWMPSVSKVVAYIEKNRADYARRAVPHGVNIAAFQKVGRDQRRWTHFVDF